MHTHNLIQKYILISIYVANSIFFLDCSAIFRYPVHNRQHNTYASNVYVYTLVLAQSIEPLRCILSYSWYALSSQTMYGVNSACIHMHFRAIVCYRTSTWWKRHECPKGERARCFLPLHPTKTPLDTVESATLYIAYAWIRSVNLGESHRAQKLRFYLQYCDSHRFM